MTKAKSTYQELGEYYARVRLDRAEDAFRDATIELLRALGSSGPREARDVVEARYRAVRQSVEHQVRLQSVARDVAVAMTTGDDSTAEVA